MINLNFPQGSFNINLGCGERRNPHCKVNVDIRAFPGVTDFTVDLNKPFTAEHKQAIADEDFDNAYSCFVIEHISWRNTRQFIKEVFRILKPGGRFILVGPNTEAQMQHLLKTQDWEDAGSMLFGSQDYPENSHKAAFSPSFYQKIFSEAGFTNIVTTPWGVKMTDMVVEAQKPELKIRKIHSYSIQSVIGTAEWNAAKEKQQVKEEHQVVVVMNPENTENPVEVVEQSKFERLNQTTTEGVAIPESTTTVTQSESVPMDDKAKAVFGTTVADVMQSQLLVGDGNGGVTPFNSSPVLSLTEQRAKQFNHAYFDGGRGQVGGYRDGYRDYSWNGVTARYVLSRYPESVFELGCARGYVGKRLEDAGVAYTGWDISKHAVMTAVSRNVFQADALASLLTVPNVYDLCLSLNFLEHIPEELVAKFCSELKGVCKRGLHGVTVLGKDDGSDKTRVNVKPLEYWQKVLPPGHEVLDVDELRNGNLPPEVIKGDGKVKLNIGSFTTQFHHGWINMDVQDLANWSQAHGYKYLRHDARDGLPFATGSVDLIYSSHMLEHLTYQEGLSLLKECRRVMKPETGVMRIIVPNAGTLTNALSNQDLNKFDEVNVGCEKAKTPMGKFWSLLGDGHKAAYDHETLGQLLEEAGFLHAWLRHREGTKQIMVETLDPLSCLSLYMEAMPKIA